MRASLVLVAVMFLSACGQSVAGPSDQLSLSLEVTPNEIRASEMRAGESVYLRMTVVNHGTSPHEIVMNVCPGPFTISTSDDEPVQPAPRICSLSLQVRMLEGGEEVELGLPWSGDVASGYLSPGEYRLRGRVPVVQGGVLLSAPQTIRILP